MAELVGGGSVIYRAYPVKFSIQMCLVDLIVPATTGCMVAEITDKVLIHHRTRK